MAPTEDFYFPSLDRCLNGEHQLLSWRSAAQSLTNLQSARSNAFLQNFLSDSAVKAVLERPSDPFNFPDTASASALQTKTSQAQVTPSSNGTYDIAEIRSDATWLSRKVNIDEISALRVVMLEWQGRPVAKLYGENAQEKGGAAFAGGMSLGASAFMPKSSILAAPILTGTDGATPEERRRRKLLKLFSDEKACIMRVIEILVRSAADRTAQSSSRITGGQQQSADEVLGEALLMKQQSSGAGFIVQCIETVHKLIGDLAVGSRYYSDEEVPDVEEAWGIGKMLEIVHVLQLIFLHLSLSGQLTSAKLVVRWFKAMNHWRFLAGFQPIFESQQSLLTVLHMTSSLVSLNILCLRLALEFLQSPPENQIRALRASTLHYLSDSAAFNEIQNYINSAIREGPGPATLAGFAWFIIQLNVRTSREEYRLYLESPEAEVGGSAADRRTQAVRALIDHFEDISVSDEEIDILSKLATGGGIAHSMIADVASQAITAFSASADRSFEQRARSTLLSLIQQSVEVTLYEPPVINAALATLRGSSNFWSVIDQPASEVLDPVGEEFLQDSVFLRPRLLETAQLRFPYEISPFLRFCTALASDTIRDPEHHELFNLLSNVPYLVQKLPEGFSRYQLAREDTEQNHISLTEDLSIFQMNPQRYEPILAKASKLAMTLAANANIVAIPAGTEGINNGDYVITWNFQFSAFAYLTTLLTTALRNNCFSEAVSGNSVPLETATEILNLFNTLLATSLKSSSFDPSESLAIKLILGIQDDDSEPPLTDIVLELFEQELQAQREHPGGEGYEVLVSCTQFVYLVARIQPDRVWPFLSQSKFLDDDGHPAVVSTTEMVQGRYHFLLASIKLYGALVDDAVSNAVKRKTAGASVGVSRAVARFGTPAIGRGSPEKIMGRSLFALTRIFSGVLESISGWRFVDLDERVTINSEILTRFGSVLTYAYGYDDSEDLNSKITAALAESAEYILAVFGSTKANDLPITPILNAIASGANRSSPSTLFGIHERIWDNQTVAALRLADVLLRINILRQRANTHLETLLFRAMPILACTFAAKDIYESPVASLLATLVTSAARSDNEPPSLLSQMGAEGSKAFLALLSHLGKPLGGEETELILWSLLSALVSSRQQWFAIFLLTGRTPKDEVKALGKKSTSPTSHPGRSLLGYALDELCKIADLSRKRSIAMLEFLMLSYNNWPWAMSALRTHPQFISAIGAFIGSLRPEDLQGSTDTTIQTAERYRMASLIAEILAMYIHQTRQTGKADAVVKDLIPRLSFLRNFAVSDSNFNIPTYNTTLHGNLEKNFAAKFPGAKIGNFKRILFTESAVGRDYFYDITFAERLLSFSPSWKGRRDDGYATDFARANVNLYLVQAQVDVIKSWQMLSAELSSFISTEPRTAPLLAKVVQDCLNANIKNSLPSTPLFNRLNQVRIDFGFILLQKLVAAKSTDDTVKDLLERTWDAIRASGQDFETAFTGPGADYYRSLLRVLLLALHPHLTGLPTNPPANHNNTIQGSRTDQLKHEAILIEILQRVIATGFRALTSSLHDAPSTPTVPADLVLLTSLLQSILKHPALRLSHQQLALTFASQGTIRHATSLFSWAESLSTQNTNGNKGDPIYADLSILFLLELSSIPAIAETMAVEGVLASLSTASIMAYFRRNAGVGPFDAQAGAARLYSVWARGLLPLCLNLLRAVGHPVAPEIAAFLNQYPKQLERTGAIMGKGSLSPAEAASGRYQVCLNMANEVHSLALLSTILEQMKVEEVNGAEIESLAIDRAMLSEDLEGFAKGRRSYLERLVPGSEREVRLAGAKASNLKDRKDAVENALEEKVMEECKAAVNILGVEAGK